MNLKKRQILEISNALNSLKELNPSSVRLLYQIASNLRSLEAERSILEEVLKPPGWAVTLEAKRSEVILKNSKKDADGNILWQVVGQIPVMEETEESVKEINEFIANNKEELDKFSTRVDEINRLLEESVKVSLSPMSLEDLLPLEGKISFNIMDALVPIIKS